MLVWLRMGFKFDNRAPRPGEWVLTGGVRERRHWWGGTVLDVEELGRVWRPVVSGHSPANWRLKRRLRKAKSADLLAIADKIHEVFEMPGLALCFEIYWANNPSPPRQWSPPKPGEPAGRQAHLFWLGRDGDAAAQRAKPRPAPARPHMVRYG